ncbi:MAG: TIGR00153 family protein [Desulfobulbia bacterium]
MRSIVGIFGKSPFEPLQEHFKCINQCVELLDPLFDAVLANDEEAVAKTLKAIKGFENDADAIKNEMRLELPRTLFMPVGRQDLFVLLDVQDGIADTVQDIGVLLSIKIPDLPENFHEGLRNLVKYSIRSVSQVTEIYEHFSALLEASFGGKPAEDVTELINKIGRTEHKADKTGYGLLEKLFNESTEMSMQDFLMFEKVMLKLSHIADLSRKTSNRLRMIISK